MSEVYVENHALLRDMGRASPHLNPLLLAKPPRDRGLDLEGTRRITQGLQ